jgi:hypothetical protein
MGYKLSLFSDIVILAASGYLLLKKGFELSISKWLLENALKQSAVDLYLYASGIILTLAIIIKALSLIFEHFPATKHASVEPEQISECLSVMNKEIASHINKCESDTQPQLTKLREQHSFDVNIRMVSEALAEHIRQSVSSIKIKRKDMFISLYSYNEASHCLKYELHYDPRRDLINSKLIDLSSDSFKDYECVKCMATSASTAYVLDKSKYARGSSKRHKTFQQYMGCKLETNGYTFGFLNIEFHNHHIFVDEEEMQDFMEENVFPFKLLLEYQYLKHHFFTTFEDLNKHWEVAV